MARITFVLAVKTALAEEMRRDARTFLVGDVLTLAWVAWMHSTVPEQRH